MPEEVLLSVHFNEEIQMTPGDAKAAVVGVFERHDLDVDHITNDRYPQAYDTQDSQVDILVETEDYENPVQSARQALNQVLVQGEGPAHHIQGKRR